MTDEAVAEVKEFLTTRSAYVNAHGELRASASVHTVDLVLNNMTG